MGVKYDECSNTCYALWIIIIGLYLIVMLSIFSSEIQEINNLKTSNSKYDDDELLTFSDSLLSAYQLTSLNPISQILILPSNSSCPVDFELLNLTIWNSYQICNSPYSFNYTIGSCPSDSKSNKANQQYTIDSKRIYLYHWGDSIFCVKRNSDWYRTTSSNCNSGYKLCPKQVCVKGNECPITNFKITNGSEQANNLNTSEDTYLYSGDVSSLKKLYVSRNYISDFIIDFAVEVNGKPCINQYETPYRSVNISFLKPKPNNCSTYGSDPAIYQKLDEQQEMEFLVQNNIKFMFQGVNFMNSTINNTAFLYSVTRTPNTCSNGAFLIDSDNSDIESFASLRYGSNIAGLVTIIMAFIIYFLFFSEICKDKKLYHSPALGVFIIITIFVQLIICPISLYYLKNIEKNDKFLNTIISEKCFEIQGYNKLFSTYGQDILINSTKIFGFIHTILYFSTIVIILLILYFIDVLRFELFFDASDSAKLDCGEFDCKDCCDDDNSTCDLIGECL